MSDTVAVPADAAEHLRIGRLLERHGDLIGAILAYRLVIQGGTEPASSEARRRIDGLAWMAAMAGAG